MIKTTDKPRWATVDWLILACLLAIALKFQFSLLYDATFTVIPNSDSGAVAAFLTGWLHEGRFAGDMILEDKAKFAFYITLVMPIVALVNLLVNDIGKSFLLLMAPIVFAHALGFYLVGRRVLDGRLAASVFAVATLAPIWTMYGDFWGIHHTPLVRMAFSALFPYMLLMAMNSQHDRRKLYFLAAFCGVALYVHGVSGPSVTIALFLGTLAYIDGRADFWDWVRKCLIAVSIFVVLVIPFAIIYLTNFPSLDENPNRGIQEILVIYGPFADLGLALKTMLGPECCNPEVGHGWRWIAFIGGLIGLITGYIWHRRFRRTYGFFLLFIAGILLMSIGVTFIDQLISRAQNKAPTQVDLIRNVRFLVPILFLGYGVLFQRTIVYLKERLGQDRRYRLLVPGLSAAFALHIIIFIVPQFNSTAPGYLSLRFDGGAKMVDLLTPDGIDELLGYLHEAQPGTRVFPLTNQVTSLAIRYQSLQPVTYIYKDRNALLYSNHADTDRFLAIRDEYDLFIVTESLELARGALCRALKLAPSDVLVLEHDLVGQAKLELARSFGPTLRDFDGVSVVAVTRVGCVA